MSDLNVYTFTGNLVADPETRYTAKGTAVWSARVAVNVGWGQNKTTNWISVSAFGKQAEALGNLDLAKGSRVGVTGELKVREYEKDGIKRTSIDVTVRDLSILSGGRGTRDEAAPPARRAPAPAQGGFEDDDIPFN